MTINAYFYFMKWLVHEKIFCEHFYWPLFWINDTCIRKLLSQLELNSLSNWIFMSLSSNLRVEPRKQNTDYNLFQALRTTAKNFQPNLHFWQIVPSPTNFPFSTGLTKSTRLLGKHERVHEMASRPNLTKKRNFRCNSFFLRALGAQTIPLPLALVGSGWSAGRV